LDHFLLSGPRRGTSLPVYLPSAGLVSRGAGGARASSSPRPLGGEEKRAAPRETREGSQGSRTARRRQGRGDGIHTKGVEARGARKRRADRRAAAARATARGKTLVQTADAVGHAGHL